MNSSKIEKQRKCRKTGRKVLKCVTQPFNRWFITKIFLSFFKAFLKQNDWNKGQRMLWIFCKFSENNRGKLLWRTVNVAYSAYPKKMQVSAFRGNSGNSREFVCYGSGWVLFGARGPDSCQTTTLPVQRFIFCNKAPKSHLFHVKFSSFISLEKNSWKFPHWQLIA